MLQQFKAYINDNALLDKESKVIIALSGGIDSIVLTELLHKSGYNVVAAHCNFHLRGEESDRDQHFVEIYCKTLNICLHTIDFDTEQYAQEQGVSIEMAARELRYTWFEQLRQQLRYDKIAVAHHADDQTETFFINLIRGSGIHGLKAMTPINGNIIRPLLWATRDMIKKYAVTNNIKWCDDSTNSQSIYTRNKLRNIIIPEINTHFAQANKGITRSIDFLGLECSLYDQLVNERIESMQTSDGNIVAMPKTAFTDNNGVQFLFEWIRRYSFNTSQCQFIHEALTNGSGQHFLSPTHRLNIERNTVLISPISTHEDSEATIHEGQSILTSPVKINIKTTERGTQPISKKNDCVMLDADKIKFPLKVRPWQHGDRFKPIGLKGSKLVSDLLTNLHLTQIEKEHTLIMEDAEGKIIWVIGQRISDHVKITNNTKRIIIFALT